MGIFSVGITGLNAAQVGLTTTGHNISNASTPGYNRQLIVQGTNVSLFTGAGFVGQGTHVQTVKRVYDEFLGRQMLGAETVAAEMDGYLKEIRQIDNLFADPNSGLSPALADFFRGVQEVAANPASIPARQSMLSMGQALVARFQALDQRLREIRDGVNSQVISQVTQINAYANELAKINQQIVIARSGSLRHEPNDLLDQRERIIRELNKMIRVTTVTQGDDGQVNAFFGNGLPLVVGSQAYQLAATASQDDIERIVVGLVGVGGTVINLPESQITGGTLGGLVGFREETLDMAQNSLGRIALTLAQNFNDQHRLGMDLAGDLGTDFFGVSDPVVKPAATNGGSGAPDVSIDAATISSLTASDYRLGFDGVQYTLTRLADNYAFPPFGSLPQTVDGITISAGTWAPAAFDSVLIQPTRTGARNISLEIADPRLIAAAAPVRTAAALANAGTGSIDAGIVIDTTTPAFAAFNTTGELTPPVRIVFGSPPTTYSVYDNTNPLAPILLQSGIPYTPGADVFPTPLPLNLDYGYRVKISGAPAAGDSFTINGNENGVSDNRNAQWLGALQTAARMIGDTATYQSAYSQIVSAIGSKTREIETIGKAQQSLAEQTENRMQSVSGVNLDEEAANLLRYQQAYQAAAKILATAAKIFDEIIALGR